MTRPDVLYVNERRTVLVRYWPNTGTVERAERLTPAHTWGPPRTMIGFDQVGADAIARWYLCKRQPDQADVARLNAMQQGSVPKDIDD